MSSVKRSNKPGLPLFNGLLVKMSRELPWDCGLPRLPSASAHRSEVHLQLIAKAPAYVSCVSVKASVAPAAHR